MSAIEGKFLETFGVEPDLVAAATTSRTEYPEPLPRL